MFIQKEKREKHKKEKEKITISFLDSIVIQIFNINIMEMGQKGQPQLPREC